MLTYEQKIKNLSVPKGMIDVVIDTDAYNEIDDQFAITYLLKSKEKLNTKAIYAAPFYNTNSTGPADGMEKSYNEIFKLLDLMDEKYDVFRGSTTYLTDEKTPVISDAALDLAERVKNYSPENPLYILAIGAITNVASAMLINPEVATNSVLVWLGGHSRDYHDTNEFNMAQDVAAARVVMSSGVPFIQLPCQGVVSAFTMSEKDLEYWFKGKNKISDYLANNVIREANSYAAGLPWTRIIWDVTAVAWLLNDNNRFMFSRLCPIRLPGYDNKYEEAESDVMTYVYYILRDCIMTDLVNKITAN